MKNINTLIIPDVHGRTFWKDALNDFPKKDYPKLTIVFLGDYLDPYDFEGISNEEALKNFKEILEITRKDKRIHLLIGNHDLHYLYPKDSCRIDYENFMEIKNLFEDNLDIIKVAYSKKVNDRKYLFTHAGVTKNWLLDVRKYANVKLLKNKIDTLENKEYCSKLTKLKASVKSLNSLLDNSIGLSYLHMISFLRGGSDLYGSCIWADVNEHLFENNSIKDDIFQIFGHSLGYPSFDKPYIDIERKFAMLDCMTSWILDNDNNLIQYK